MLSVKEKILESLKLVLENKAFVQINKQKIPDLAKKIEKIPLPGWDDVLQFSGSAEEIIQYYFFLDSINFCFWNIPTEKRWEFQKDGEWMHGYYAFSYAIKKAILEDRRLLDFSYLSQISFVEFSRIFDGRGELLLFEERWKIVKENFKILGERYQGKAVNLVAASRSDVNNLVELIISDFPSFCDYAKFEGKEVFFLKRAQLFVSDINYALRGEGPGYFKNMEDLTIFADYKLPQYLQAKGVLVYSAELKNKIEEYKLVGKDSLEEIEIRANTIYACELIKSELEKLGRKLTSNNVDWILWVLSKENRLAFPYHRTVTVNY
jgi:hypothetical protein